MKRDLMTMALDLGDELIIDNFAGGGGTSTGLEWAFGRPVDIAINHDPEALAMHAANHPHTKHLCESVWDVDPIKVTGNQPVGLVWLSPDCKHFSKAKGGKPVEKKIRGLAWVTLRWANKCKPRVIMLENVEEFKTWGPLKMTMVDGEEVWHPDPAKKGKTFDSFIRQLRRQGYDVEYGEMRASDHDTPTIRKRFFLVARRDGLPIRWPAATHGAPKTLAVQQGKLRAHRTAAECIDWSLPCPSIFDRKKPLADATLRRIAKGIMRYVVDAAEPFIVGQGGPIYSGKPKSTAEPFGTLTTENHRAIVLPTIVPVTHQGGDRNESINEPFRTITGAKRGEKALGVATLVQVGYGEREGQAPRALDIEKPLGTVVGGASKHALVTAFLNEHANSTNQRVMPADEPLRTICAQVKGGHFSMVAASLVGVGGRAGDSRPRGADEPTATITAKGDTANATAFLAKHYTGVVGSDLDDPLGTVTSSDHHSLVTAHITKFRTGAVGSSLAEPLHTVTAGGNPARPSTGNTMGIIAAKVARVGPDDVVPCLSSQAPIEQQAAAFRILREAFAENTESDCANDAVAASSLVKLRGTSTAAAMDEPLGTVSAGGQHHAEVRAFLVKYYGSDQDPRLEEPLHTVTSRDRFGLVTIKGQDYQIVDIGLRMLAPRELFRAQGFPDSYIIDKAPDWDKLFVDGQQVADIHSIPWRTMTKSSQVRMCGNSVCPPMARALIEANFGHEREIARVA